MGLPERRRRRADEGADQRLQRRASRDPDQRDDPRMGRALLHQGPHLGGGRAGAGRDDLPPVAPADRAERGRAVADHRRGPDERRPRDLRLLPGLDRGGDQRRPALRRALRYPRGRALLQQDAARGDAVPRRRRQSDRDHEPRRLRRRAEGDEGQGRRDPALLPDRRRRRHVAGVLHAVLPAGRHVDRERRGAAGRQRRQGREGDPDHDRLAQRRATRPSRPSTRPRSRCSPPATPPSISTASGRSRPSRTCRPRARSANGARSRSRSSSTSRRPGRTATPSPSRPAAS